MYVDSREKVTARYQVKFDRGLSYQNLLPSFFRYDALQEYCVNKCGVF